MMLNIDDIKELVRFARQLKVKTLQIGDVKFEMSDYAFIEDVTSSAPAPVRENLDSAKNWSDDKDNMSPEEYDELLFHSSNG